MRLEPYQRAFIMLWTLERAADAVLTYHILGLGGVELNAIVRRVLEWAGRAEGLALWSMLTITLGILLGIYLPAALEWGLRRARRLTSLEKAMIEAYGVRGISKIILALAAVIGSTGPVLNALCIMRAHMG
ncbi:MAG: hypothetical protein GSR80_000714 [Desulfurococcales archaeon]|nr:hypothetical protein [Desulfurococcales archaeon]